VTTDLQALTPDRLRGRRTLKWASQPDDVLAMWVAEMDYPTAPAITAALHRAVDAETFGYPLEAGPSGLAAVVVAELAGRHGWTVAPEDVFLVADVMRGLSLALEAFSGPDDPVIITTPVYMPFFDVVSLSGRPQVHVPMVEVDGRPTFDLEALDRAFTEGARTVLLCNPYNPLGRVFDRDELLAFAEVVERHGGRPGRRGRDPRAARPRGHSPPVCVPVGGHGRPYRHAPLGQQGVEPAWPQVRSSRDEQRGGSGCLATHPALGEGGCCFLGGRGEHCRIP
jgi:Aminotransferase class I and II